MKHIPKNKLIFFSILILALLLRLIFLDRIPTGISNDEYYFILNAKSVFYNFISLFKNGWNYQVFQNILTGINSETSILIMAPILGLLPSTLFFARLPYVYISLLILILIYKITLKNTRNTNIALLAALVSAINPWSIYVSRTSFDAPVALLFFLLTLYLQSFAKPKFIILSALSSLLAFNGYIGTKVIYLPFMLCSLYYSWKYIHRKKFIRPFVFVAIFSIFITTSFVLNLSSSVTGNRRSELVYPSSPSIVTEAIDSQNQSLATPFKNIFSSRYFVYLKTFVNKYLYNFSTDILFLDGDHTFMVSLWKMGYFYYLDFFLIILGIIYLFNYHRHFLSLLIFSILLSPIPEAIRLDKIPAYAFHSALQYPFLLIILGSGTYYAWQLLQKNILKLAFVSTYLILFFNFIDLYFYKYPVYQSEGFFMSRQILSKFLQLESAKSNKIVVITSEPEAVYRNYLYFSKQYKYQNYQQISSEYSLHPGARYFEWGNIIITDQTPETKEKDTVYIVDQSISNYPFSSEKHSIISTLGDHLPLYKIYFSQSCTLSKFNTNYEKLTMTDLRLDKLSESDFCQNYFSESK